MEAHGICWHECRCDGSGNCAFAENDCADFTCDNAKWRRQPGKNACVQDQCTQVSVPELLILTWQLPRDSTPSQTNECCCCVLGNLELTRSLLRPCCASLPFGSVGARGLISLASDDAMKEAFQLTETACLSQYDVQKGNKSRPTVLAIRMRGSARTATAVSGSASARQTARHAAWPPPVMQSTLCARRAGSASPMGSPSASSRAAWLAACRWHLAGACRMGRHMHFVHAQVN